MSLDLIQIPRVGITRFDRQQEVKQGKQGGKTKGEQNQDLNPGLRGSKGHNTTLGSEYLHECLAFSSFFSFGLFFLFSSLRLWMYELFKSLMCVWTLIWPET